MVGRKDSVSLENQKQAQVSESDLDLSEQAILQDCLNTRSDSEVDSDDDMRNVLVHNVCSNCKHSPNIRVVKLLATVASIPTGENTY